MTDNNDVLELDTITNNIDTPDMGTLNIAEMCESLETMEDKIPLTSNYFNPEVGVVTKCFFWKHDRISPAEGNKVDTVDGLIEAVRFILQDQTSVLNASTILVDIIKENNVKPLQALELIKTEEVKKGNKTYFKWAVSLLS